MPVYHIKPTVPQLHRGHRLAQGLVAAWPFFERGGTTLRDLVGSNPTALNGTIGTGITWKTGAMGAMLNFTGSGEVLCGDSDAAMLEGLAACTWVWWMRPANLTQAAGIINKRIGSTNADSYSLGLCYNTTGEFNVQTLNVNYRFSTTGWSTTELQHYCAVHDANASANNRVKLYRNGVPVPLVTAASDVSAVIFNSTTPLSFGRVNRSGSFYYSGDLGSISFYNRAWTQTDAARDYVDPWAIYRAPRRVWFMPSSAATLFRRSLTARAGSRSVNGGF